MEGGCCLLLSGVGRETSHYLGDWVALGRIGWWGRNIFKETLKDHLDHRGDMWHEVLTSGVQFCRPERPGITLGSFVLGLVLRWYCGPLLNMCWHLTCIVVFDLDLRVLVLLQSSICRSVFLSYCSFVMVLASTASSFVLWCVRGMIRSRGGCVGAWRRRRRRKEVKSAMVVK